MPGLVFRSAKFQVLLASGAFLKWSGLGRHPTGFAPLLISVEGKLRFLAFCVSSEAALTQHLLDIPVNLDCVFSPHSQ